MPAHRAAADGENAIDPSSERANAKESEAHPLWTALRGGIESFQLDKSCAMLLLAGAAMAAFGVVVALVVGSVREVDVTWMVVLFVGAAALSALVGGWIWRRSRRRGVRPLGLRIVAVVQLLLFAPPLVRRALTWGGDERWRAAIDLFFLGFWIVQAVGLWRMGGGPRRSGESPAPAEEASTGS